MLDGHWACMIVLVRQGRAPPALCFLRKDTYMCNAKGQMYTEWYYLGVWGQRIFIQDFWAHDLLT